MKNVNWFAAHRAALMTLIIMQGVMLLAMFFQLQPHPPRAVAPFAMAPFLAASIALATAALIFEHTRDVPGKILTVLACLTALVSYGPHKWIDAAIPEIWPAVLTAEVAVMVLIAELVVQMRQRNI